MAEPTSSTPSSSPGPQRSGRSWLWRSLAAGVTVLLAACGSVPHFGSKPGASGPAAGTAATREYRQDAARHIYARNQQRIYKGQLPPMLYAVGVLEVEVDRSGNVRRLRWLRAPSHAPEVVAEIERTVRAASPFPAPSHLSGKMTYTDTWLWDQSGRFQLDTLTEGQRGE
ncbi:MAG: hypothetical protein LBE51_13320 [Acidovorax sp.]|nr:hypothetical protein [Acidovorax sp.]